MKPSLPKDKTIYPTIAVKDPQPSSKQSYRTEALATKSSRKKAEEIKSPSISQMDLPTVSSFRQTKGDLSKVKLLKRYNKEIIAMYNASEADR